MGVSVVGLAGNKPTGTENAEALLRVLGRIGEILWFQNVEERHSEIGD